MKSFHCQELPTREKNTQNWQEKRIAGAYTEKFCRHAAPVDLEYPGSWIKAISVQFILRRNPAPSVATTALQRIRQLYDSHPLPGC